ncbi:unnamed protein product [Bemisia tabaci]|uniref:Uncharacterized protein n=1 Tax=Bemisia tabaci TaxID=7038 RepID=A0A9P0C9U3_BEMTA|nr:PREDICTED: RING finger and CHY zinc finger domain-containing protein 1 [Bemisia tabaci]CAH0774724.1 unnamed protein product [Bemisia tabaci]
MFIFLINLIKCLFSRLVIYLPSYLQISDSAEMELDQPNNSQSEIAKHGCTHYQRKSKFVTPCCDKVYPCRVCHDDNESHTLNRKEVSELICCECETRQKVQATCENCSIDFGKYTCLECRLFDDVDKKQYHCEGCGICRVGGRDNFFHCFKCNLCLPNSIKDSHKCIENVSRGDCPVCMEDLHTSRQGLLVPSCGHIIHKKCQKDMFEAGFYNCPLCLITIPDMSQYWAELDARIAEAPMPKKYKDKKVDILCRDCHKNSTAPFHVYGLKCSHCGSYNTC